MREVYITSDNIVSPIGFTAADNFRNLSAAVSGIKQHNITAMSDVPFYAALFDNLKKLLPEDVSPAFTKFEQLLLASITDAGKNSEIDLSDKSTILIISSTKGNVSLLETEPESTMLYERISLHGSAKKIARHFGFVNEPVVVSNACISGLLAILMGVRLIQSGQYEHAVIAGADVISKFVLSGFQSFQAISQEPCKPFDEKRNGINLGEAAGTMIISADKKFSKGIKIAGGSVSNDANHISGPSRTGEELFQAIQKAMDDAGLTANDIGFISAHGTATLFNDEMEAKAINLANMQHVPVNSMKGYYGHTLGAAGLIESIICSYSLHENRILPTLGFNKIGVSEPVNVCEQIIYENVQHCLKTASGFGGCNAAVVFSKH